MPTDTTTKRRSLRHYAGSWLTFLISVLVFSLLASWLFGFEFGFSDMLVWACWATLGTVAAWGSDLWKQRRTSPQPPHES